MVMPGAVHSVGWPMATMEHVCLVVRFMAIRRTARRMRRPSWAVGESGRKRARRASPLQKFNKPIIFDIRLCLNATIIDGDPRSRALRGLANGDNGTCLFGVSIHGNPPYGATHASPVMGRW